MNIDLFRTIIAENQEYIGDISLVERPLALEENGNYVFVGVRQAGKSYLLYQTMQQLIQAGMRLEDIVYVNFDDERLKEMTAMDFDLILQAYHSMFEGKPVFFFGEIYRYILQYLYHHGICALSTRVLSLDIIGQLCFQVRRERNCKEALFCG